MFATKNLRSIDHLCIYKLQEDFFLYAKFDIRLLGMSYKKDIIIRKI